MRLCIVFVTQKSFKEKATFISKYKTYSGLPVAGITVAASKYTECNTFQVLKARNVESVSWSLDPYHTARLAWYF